MNDREKALALLQDIDDCLADDGDGQGYLFDIIQDNRDMLAKAMQPKEQVDVETLKNEVINHVFKGGMSAKHSSFLIQCIKTAINHLNAKGMLRTPLPKIKGLDEALAFRKEDQVNAIKKRDNYYGMNKDKPHGHDINIYEAARKYKELSE